MALSSVEDNSIHENIDEDITKLDTFFDYDNFDSDDETDEYSCDQCDFKSGDNKQLKEHIKSIHKQNIIGNKRKHDGDINPTQKKSKGNSNLISRTEEKFSCDQCKFKAHVKRSLTSHAKKLFWRKFFED